MNKYLKLLLIIILIFLVSNVALFKIHNFLENKENYLKHKSYFQKPLSEQKIEEWMTLPYIKKNFEIDRKDFKEITKNKDLKLKDLKLTLEEYCEKEKLNCTQLTLDLNKIGEKNKK